MVSSAAAHPDRSPDEMVEHIDQNGVVIGLVTRQQMRQDRLRHRAVFIAVVSSNDQLLIHQRALSKDIWPGWWDIAVGGVVGPGETWEQAAVREMSEELGIEPSSVQLLGTGAYRDRDVDLVAATFICRSDGPFHFADGEIIQAQWVSKAELMVWLSTKSFLPDSVALVLPRLP